MPELFSDPSVVLLREPSLPDAEIFRATCAQLGIPRVEPLDPPGDWLGWALPGGVFVWVHPHRQIIADLDTVYVGEGPTRAHLKTARGCLEVRTSGAELPTLPKDVLTLRLLTALARATPALAILGPPYVEFIDPQEFDDEVVRCFPDKVPVELLVSVTGNRISRKRFQLFSCGLRRHGQRELHIRAPVKDRERAADLFHCLARDALMQDPSLAKATIVGFSATECWRPKRAPHPMGEGRPDVVRIDL